MNTITIAGFALAAVLLMVAIGILLWQRSTNPSALKFGSSEILLIIPLATVVVLRAYTSVSWIANMSAWVDLALFLAFGASLTIHERLLEDAKK